MTETQNLTLDLALIKKDLEFEKERSKKNLEISNLKNELELSKKLSKKDLEFEKKSGKKDVELERAKKDLEFQIERSDLQNDLKNSKTALVARLHTHSIRAVIGISFLTSECLFDANQKTVQGCQNKINAEMKSNQLLVKNIKEWCSKLHTTFDKKDAASIYHSISTHIHGGKYPIECHTNNQIFSSVEKALKAYGGNGGKINMADYAVS